jgi:hypothetical protein
MAQRKFSMAIGILGPPLDCVLAAGFMSAAFLGGVVQERRKGGKGGKGQGG